MEGVGHLVRSISNYNPLAGDNSVEAVGDPSRQTWVCVAPGGVEMHTSPTVLSPEKKVCEFAARIYGKKEGDWLRDGGTGMYLPFFDAEGCRNFKNERLLLMERSQAEPVGMKRTSSGSSSDFAGALKRSLSGKSRSESLRSGSSQELNRRQSFRWVDSEGVSRRLAGDSEVLAGVEERPEVWICAKGAGVQFCDAPISDAVTNRVCIFGEKVTALKEDNWLRIMEVKDSFDLLSAAESMARRSFKPPTRVTLSFTGLYLPYSDFATGERLFKSEKLALFEASQQGVVSQKGGVTPSNSRKAEETCSIM